MIGYFQKCRARPQTRQNNLTVSKCRSKIESGADRIFIQRDATGRSAADYPPSLINR